MRSYLLLLVMLTNVTCLKIVGDNSQHAEKDKTTGQDFQWEGTCDEDGLQWNGIENKRNWIFQFKGIDPESKFIQTFEAGNGQLITAVHDENWEFKRSATFDVKGISDNTAGPVLSGCDQGAEYQAFITKGKTLANGNTDWTKVKQRFNFVGIRFAASETSTFTLKRWKCGADGNQYISFDAVDTRITGGVACEGVMTVTSQTGVNDDPHVTNVLGQRMDIYSEGWLPLVTVPAGAEAPYLRVDVLIENLALGSGTACHETYVTRGHITGSFIQQNITIQSKPKLSVMLGGEELSPETCVSETCTFYHDQKGLEISGNGKKVIFSIPAFDSSTLQDGKGKLRIDAEHMHKSYLNVHVSGLDTFAKKWGVGGILGDSEEDFEKWTTPKGQCDKASLLMQGNHWGGSVLVATRETY